jgi:hypothetical protein
MAEGVGKSAAWVNGLLRWRRDGFREDTPFGAQSQERDERHDERIREQESLGPKQQHDEQQRSGPKQKRSSRQRAKREPHIHGLNRHDRDTLVKVLGLLGSAFDNEALAAARQAEAMRTRLNLTWDDLIAVPVEEQRRAA